MKAVLLPRSIHQLVAEEAARRGTTATALMLTAISVTHDQLPKALRVTDEPAQGAFDIPQDRASHEAKIQTTLRLTDRQLEVINELVTTTATNRSKVFTVAIRLYLLGQ